MFVREIRAHTGAKTLAVVDCTGHNKATLLHCCCKLLAKKIPSRFGERGVYSVCVASKSDAVRILHSALHNSPLLHSPGFITCCPNLPLESVCVWPRPKPIKPTVEPKKGGGESGILPRRVQHSWTKFCIHWKSFAFASTRLAYLGAVARVAKTTFSLLLHKSLTGFLNAEARTSDRQQRFEQQNRPTIFHPHR